MLRSRRWPKADAALRLEPGADPPEQGEQGRLHAPAGLLQGGNAVDPLAQRTVQEQRRHGTTPRLQARVPGSRPYCLTRLSCGAGPGGSSSKAGRDACRDLRAARIADRFASRFCAARTTRL